MIKGNLYQQCSDLPYSQSMDLSDRIVADTASKLKKLFLNHGYANVFGELAQIWSLEKAIPFFSKLNYQTNNFNQIHTIATHYPRAYNGGVERVQAQLMTLWVKMGYQVILLTEEAENRLDFSYPRSVKRFIIPSTINITDRLKSIQQICLNEKVDLYINHHWGSSTVLWECMMLKMLHIPFIQYVHAHFAWNIGDSKENLYQPELFKLCDLVVSLSETNARFYQLCGCNSYLVQNPVPEDLLTNKELSKLDSNHILLVGRLSAEKHPMDAIKIFKFVHEQLPDTVLDVVGGDDGSFIPQMQSYIQQNDFQDHVIFHGKKTQSEIAEFYKHSACVLFTSEMEGYPMVILEAKAYGLPIVMYELPYLSLTKDGQGILSAPFGDINTLALHIIKLLTQNDFRTALGRSSHDSFINFSAYDLEANWKNIIDLCSPEKVIIHVPSYFNPSNVSYADKFIEPILLDKLKKGYDHVIDSNFDYHVGQQVLRLPRKIKKILHILKGALPHEK